MHRCSPCALRWHSATVAIACTIVAADGLVLAVAPTRGHAPLPLPRVPLQRTLWPVFFRAVQCPSMAVSRQLLLLQAAVAPRCLSPRLSTN
jgi:hypothetical protein